MVNRRLLKEFVYFMVDLWLSILWSQWSLLWFNMAPIKAWWHVPSWHIMAWSPHSLGSSLQYPSGFSIIQETLEHTLLQECRRIDDPIFLFLSSVFSLLLSWISFLAPSSYGDNFANDSNFSSFSDSASGGYGNTGGGVGGYDNNLSYGNPGRGILIKATRVFSYSWL